MPDIFQSQYWSPGPEQRACGMGLTACGHFSSKNHTLNSRSVDETVFALVASGMGTLRIGQRSWTCDGPGIWVIPAHVEHGYASNHERGWDLWWAHGFGSQLQAVFQHAGFGLQYPWQPIADARRLVGFWQQLVLDLTRAKPADGYALMRSFAAVLYAIPEAIQGSFLQPVGDLGRIDYRCHDLAPLAAAAGCSVTTYIKRFRKAVGVSPWQYILARRLDRARELLCANDAAVAHVAEQSGFADPDYFSRFFKKKIGCTPRQFRERYRHG